jgi:WXG100 family type VII secretion target
MTLQLEHDAFATALDEVREAADRLHEARARVGSDVDSLLSGGWRGVAAHALAEGWADWQAGARDVLDGLAALGRILEAVHGDLTERDLDGRVALDAVAARIVDRLGG